MEGPSQVEPTCAGTRSLNISSVQISVFFLPITDLMCEVSCLTFSFHPFKEVFFQENRKNTHQKENL